MDSTVDPSSISLGLADSPLQFTLEFVTSSWSGLGNSWSLVNSLHVGTHILSAGFKFEAAIMTGQKLSAVITHISHSARKGEISSPGDPQ
jgi:hypothetical protein